MLALEPRHFGALSGLGMIRARQDRVDEAVEAFAKALAIHPHLEGARQKLDELRRKQRDGAI
ncbi:MAG: tetratricopeptide repeat protein [Alphaproteobacteria bacterium]